MFEGLGFDGIGVAFIGRNSPFGVVLAAILFGILDHGGLAIDVSTRVPREIVLVLKAAILIFLSSPGPIFYVQDRVGTNFKHFKCCSIAKMYQFPFPVHRLNPQPPLRP